MALDSLLLRLAMVASWAALASAQAMRGAVETSAMAAAEYPMKKVPKNPHSDLAIASMIAAVGVPVVSLAVMFWLKEKAWYGACYLIGGLIFFAWLFCAYLAL